MQHIDFRTSHNIVIRFEAAGPWERLAAFVIDSIIVSIIFGILVNVMPEIDFLNLLFVIILFFSYHFTFEVFNLGQSLGKKLLKIRVVTIDGDVPSLNQYFTRWAFRLLDIMMTSGMLAWLSIFSSDRGQRIGDLMAGTTVIKATQSYNTNYNSALQESSQNYQPTYPGVVRYNDDEMLLLKNVIQRYKLSKTQENENNVVLMGDKIAKDIKFRIPQYGYLNFLEKVLEDYIILTRK